MSPGLLFFLATMCFSSIAAAERPNNAHSPPGREEHAEVVRVRPTGILQRDKEPLAKHSLLEVSEGIAAASAHTDPEQVKTSAQKHDEICGAPEQQSLEKCGKEGSDTHRICEWEPDASTAPPTAAKGTCHKMCEFPPCYVVTEDEKFHKGDLKLNPEDAEYDKATEDIYTKMRKTEKYSDHLGTKNQDGSDLAGSKIGELPSHQDDALVVSDMYDTIRKRLNRQEKMLNIKEVPEGFSVKNFAKSGEEALEHNEAYHKMLEKYVQGLYQMAAGANKLTHDTYIRHAGIATHLYDTVKDASTYYALPATGIEATVNNEEGFDHMAHHKEALKAFKEAAGDSRGGGLSDAEKQEQTKQEKTTEKAFDGTCEEYWAANSDCREATWRKKESAATLRASSADDIMCCQAP